MQAYYSYFDCNWIELSIGMCTLLRKTISSFCNVICLRCWSYRPLHCICICWIILLVVDDIQALDWLTYQVIYLRLVLRNRILHGMGLLQWFGWMMYSESLQFWLSSGPRLISFFILVDISESKVEFTHCIWSFTCR